MWSYGDPNEPKADDPRFESNTTAISAAVEASNSNMDQVLAVWDDETGECTTLVWVGWVYSA